MSRGLGDTTAGVSPDQYLNGVGAKEGTRKSIFDAAFRFLWGQFGAIHKPNEPAGGKYDMWPRYPGVFIRRPVEHDAGDEAVPEREAVVGRWGLISAMTKADGPGQGRQAVDL